MRRTLTIALVLLAACLLPACKAAPRTLAEARESGLDAADIWTAQRTPSLPPHHSTATIALADLTVEFVTSKFETGNRRQAAFIPPHPVFLAAGAAGVGRKDVEFADDDFEAIANELGRALSAALAARGYELLPTTTVQAPQAYTELEPLPDGEHRDVRELNLAATDTGRVRAMRQVPALGTRLLPPASNSQAATRLAPLREQLGADAALSITLRVGVYMERASLEEGSRISIATPDKSGSLLASHSLLSDTTVLDESSESSDRTVSHTAYLQAIRETAPIFIDLALDRLTD